MLNRARWGLMLVGVIATTFGGLGTAYLFFPHGPAQGVWNEWQFWADFGPPLVLLGLITLLCAVLGLRRWRWGVLSTGLLLLAIGGCPWAYTPTLTHDRPGGEAAGMTGTIIFILVGLPGLLITGVGAGLVLGQRLAGWMSRLTRKVSAGARG